MGGLSLDRKLAQHGQEDVEAILPNLFCPFIMKLSQTGEYRLGDGLPFRTEVDETPIASFRGAPFKVAKLLKLADQIVDGLSRHSLLARQIGWSLGDRQRVREHGEMGLLEVGETRFVNGLQHTVSDVLPDYPQQCAEIGRTGFSDRGFAEVR